MNLRKLRVRLQISDQTVRQEFVKIISSMEGFEIYTSGEPGIADLLVMQLGDQPEAGIQQAQQAIASGIVGHVFLTAKTVKPEILIEAMRAGVKEYFPQPLRTEDVKKALSRILQSPSQDSGKSDAPRKQGIIVNIMGSKGGVGTTTVAVNLATSLAALDRERSVALIDMNLLFGEIPMFLGIDSIFDWVEVAKNVYRIDTSYLMGVMSLDRSGVRVLPSPAKMLDEFMVTPTVIETLLTQMKSMFDYIVIDSGQSLDDISRTIIRLSDNQIIVTLLSLPCLVNVKRLQEAFHKIGYPPDDNVKILVNRYQKKAVISIEDAEKSLKRKIYWSIPNDFQATMSAINQGKPLSAVEPHSEITDSFKEFALRIAGKTARKKSLLSWK